MCKHQKEGFLLKYFKSGLTHALFPSTMERRKHLGLSL